MFFAIADTAEGDNVADDVAGVGVDVIDAPGPFFIAASFAAISARFCFMISSGEI